MAVAQWGVGMSLWKCLELLQEINYPHKLCKYVCTSYATALGSSTKTCTFQKNGLL